MRAFGLLVVAVSLACATAPRPSPSTMEIPTDLRAEVARASALGDELFRYDTAAAVATDALLATVPEGKRGPIAGFLACPGPENVQGTFVVVFFSANEKVLHQVLVAGGKAGDVRTFDPPEAPSPWASGAMRARRIALAAVPKGTQPINPVVLADPGGTGWLVYVLAGTTRPDTVALGQHFRVTVSNDAAFVREVEPLSRSAIVLSTAGPKGEKPAALMVTHLVSGAPLETHVLASLQARLSLYVSTSRGLWVVDGANIAFRGAR